MNVLENGAVSFMPIAFAGAGAITTRELRLELQRGGKDGPGESKMIKVDAYLCSMLRVEGTTEMERTLTVLRS